MGAASREAVAADPSVTITPIFSGAYVANDINVVANSRNAIASFNGYEYAAFYGGDAALTNGYRYVCVARRPSGGSTWSTVRTGYSVSNSVIADDHCSISIGVDGNGYMSIAFGTHAAPMRYITTTTKVDTAAWTSLSFRATANFGDPLATNAVTYPEFYNIPGSKDLLFTYRNGGSGNGDMYVVRYDATAKTFSPTRVIDGTSTSVSAYTNNLVHDSRGNLLMSWVWRETGGYQTNHDIMLVKSADEGKTWTDFSGLSLSMPLSPANVTPAITIPQGSSLINTTTMAVDHQDRPLIATWYAPEHENGNEVRQYMLDWWDGAKWIESPVTRRTSETVNGQITTTVPTNDNNVRELGRPLVLLDELDRVLVVHRSIDNGNCLEVAYSTDRINWDFVRLNDVSLGNWESASYDKALWESENKLTLLYEQVGSGSPAGTISMLEWDARAYFDSIPEPATIAVLAPLMLLGLRRRTGILPPTRVASRNSQAE